MGRGKDIVSYKWIPYYGIWLRDVLSTDILPCWNDMLFRSMFEEGFRESFSSIRDGLIRYGKIQIEEAEVDDWDIFLELNGYSAKLNTWVYQ